jgi:uncharacterized protein YdeI (BOF family)
MKIFLLTALSILISFSALACDGSGKTKDKKPETPDERSL